MIRVTITGGDVPWRVHVTPSTYSEAAKTVIGGVPGVQWMRDTSTDNGRGFYSMPVDAWEAARPTVEGAGLAQIRECRAPGEPSWTATITPGLLYPYQVEGAQWLLDALHLDGAGWLADEMGLGKTAQAIAAAEAYGKVLAGGARVTVVCPAIVVPTWRAEARRVAEKPEAITVYSYEGFQKAKRKGSLPPCDVLVLDEVHYLSNSKAARSKAVAEYLVNPARFHAGELVAASRPKVIALSGTPLTARPRDLHHPLDVLFPGRFGNWFQFTKRYCGGKFLEIPNTDRTFWSSDGSSHEPELAARLRHVMLRRTKSEVALQLPTLQRSIVPVDLPIKVRRALAKSSAIAGESAGFNVGFRAHLDTALAATEDHKVQAAIELARELVAAGQKPLVFTTRKETARQIATALDAPCATGDDAASTRAEILKSASDAAVATIYSVGIGVTLTQFDAAIFVGLDWLPSNLLQAEARIHRIGQERPVTIYYLIGLGTVDEVIQSKVIERLDRFEALIGKEDTALATSLRGGTEDELIASIVASLEANGK